MAAGGATGVGSSEVVVEVPFEDLDDAHESEEAERLKKRQAHVTSQSDR